MLYFIYLIFIYCSYIALVLTSTLVLSFIDAILTLSIIDTEMAQVFEKFPCGHLGTIWYTYQADLINSIHCIANLNTIQFYDKPRVLVQYKGVVLLV